MDSTYFPFYHLDASLFESINEYPLHVINDLSYNPFKESKYLNSVDSYVRGNAFLEPECNYYFCEDLSNTFSISKDLKLLSYNISSLPLHFDSF